MKRDASVAREVMEAFVQQKLKVEVEKKKDEIDRLLKEQAEKETSTTHSN